MIRIKSFKFALSFLLISALPGFASLKAEGVENSASSHIARIDHCLVYIGTYTGAKSKGIYACRMNLTNGTLTPLGLQAETPNPTFLAVDPRHQFLFTANEIGNYEGKRAGSVTAFSINQETGSLTFLARHSSVGSGPCHLGLDKLGCHVLLANYGSGSMTVLPVQSDGQFGDDTAFVQNTGRSVNSSRQTGPHAHCVTLDAGNRFAFACDLGTDKTMIYRFDPRQGTLTTNDPPFVQAKPGSGPRHMAFHPDGGHAYIVYELDSSIGAFAYDRRHGTLKEMQTISTLPRGFNGNNIAAEVEVHPAGRFLYASNRGDDSIAVFSIDPLKGTLTPVEHQHTGGKTPRHFAIDPTGRYLLVANQDSDNIAVFAVDSWTGRLKPTGQVLEVPTPTCVLFAPPAPQTH